LNKCSVFLNISQMPRYDNFFIRIHWYYGLLRLH